MPFFEGDSLNLTCYSDEKGFPQVHLFRWFKNLTLQTTDTEIYQYGQVTAEDNNIPVFCNVVNSYTLHKDIHLNSSVTKLAVEYKPRISLPERNITITEGDSINVRCTASGNPEPNVVWTFNNATIGKSAEIFSELVINDTQRDKNGMYTCCAHAESTKHGELHSSASTFVTVNYSPDVMVSLDSQNLTEGGSATFICNAVGRPDSYNFSGWKHTYRKTFIRQIESHKSNMLLLKSLSYQDIGTYTCFVENGIMNKDNILQQTGSKELTLRGIPIMVPAVSDIPRFTAELTHKLRANIQFFTVQNITGVQWFNLSSNSAIDSTDTIQINTDSIEIPYEFYGKKINLSDFAFSASLTIDRFQQFHAGYYSLIVSNGEGSSNFTVRISISGPPEAPRNITYEVFEVSLKLYIVPGYNGGHDQMIHINYTICNSQITTKTKTIEVVNDRIEMVYIQNLLPSTRYCITVFSSNTKGYSSLNESHCCVELILQTLEREKTHTSSKEIEIVGGVTSSIITVTAIIIVIGVLVRRRSKHKDDDTAKLKRGINKSEEDNDDDGLKDNILYGMVCSVPAAIDNQDSNAKKNEKKNGTKKKKGAANDKGIEMRDVYENSEDILKLESGPVYGNVDQNASSVKQNVYKPRKNKDGLIYADLQFNTSTKTFVIHGLENRSNYAVIDLTKKAEPLPSDSSDEEERTKPN